MDHQTEYPFNRHAEKALPGFGDLDSPTTEGHPRSSGGRMEDLGVGSGSDNPPSSVLISMFRGQTHRNVRTPLAATVIIRRLRRLGSPNQTTRTCDCFLGPSKVGVGQLDLNSPTVTGEVDLRPLNLSPHLPETQSLKRKLEPVGISDLGATPHRGGLVLHDGQRAIICALNNVAASG
jgi:hypothetical protein